MCASSCAVRGWISFSFSPIQPGTFFSLALFFAAVFMVLDPYTSWFDTYLGSPNGPRDSFDKHVRGASTESKWMLGEMTTSAKERSGLSWWWQINCGMIVAVATEACGMCFVAELSKS